MQHNSDVETRLTSGPVMRSYAPRRGDLMQGTKLVVGSHQRGGGGAAGSGEFRGSNGDYFSPLPP